MRLTHLYHRTHLNNNNNNMLDNKLPSISLHRGRPINQVKNKDLFNFVCKVKNHPVHPRSQINKVLSKDIQIPR